MCIGKSKHGRSYQDNGDSILEVSKRQGEPWRKGLPKPSEEPAEEHIDGSKSTQIILSHHSPFPQMITITFGV